MNPIFTQIEWSEPAAGCDYALYFPARLFKKLGLETNAAYILQTGSFHAQILVKINEHTHPLHNKISCSETLASRINIPAGSVLTLRLLGRIIRIGPLIGLLTVKFDNPENPFGRQAKFLRALCDRASRAGALVYVFTPEDILPDNIFVSGYIPELPQTDADEKCIVQGDSENSYDASENREPPMRWMQLTLPWPDIVYNRIPSRYWEKQDACQNALAYIQNIMQIPVFNPGFLDKCEVQEKLVVHAIAHRYLPEGTVFAGPETLALFADRHRQIYLKPSSGSLGRRIIKISKEGEQFKYKYRTKDGVIIEGEQRGAAELVKILRPVMENRVYLMQQAVPLALYEGREFDIRLLMQKDRFGRWRRTKAYVRIVQPGGLTANLNGGAVAKSIVEVIRQVFNEDFLQPAGIGENIRRAAEEVALAVEECFPGIWAELGLDFGIDVHGKLWLIEVNSKPFRALTTSVGLTQRIERSFLRPLEFARFFTGFYPHSI